MKKHTIKNITLRRLIQIFSIAIISVMIIIFLGYRHFFTYTIEDKALEIANLVKAGLTSHMKADIMDKRKYFLAYFSGPDEHRQVVCVPQAGLSNTERYRFYQIPKGDIVKVPASEQIIIFGD